MELAEKLKEVKEIIRYLSFIEQATGIIYWDMRVAMPKKAINDRAELIGYLSSEGYKRQTGIKVKNLINYFQDKLDELNEIDRAMIEKLIRDYNEVKKIPENRYKEYVILCSKSQQAWEGAKIKNDYNLFKPYLEEIINYQQEFIEYRGYSGNKYNVLLDTYERDITVEKLDKLFKELKDGILILLDKIKKCKIKIDSSPFKKYFSKKDQEDFSLYLLQKIGYDFDAGKVDESIHPFTINFGNKDVRITTNYLEHQFKSAVFSTIHECGHAIYEQNIPDYLLNTGLGTGTSMGIHESQSRFYENIIGRSKAFWIYFYPEVLKRFPQFKGVTFDNFYKGINEVEPSLIRTEADELTYSIHIIIRYEIEKALINGEISVDELPEIWNKKYKEYLGIEPNCYADGILQDVHWSDGSFGYFPSYALGNLYGAQMFFKLQKDIPNLYDEIQKGNLLIIKQWLKENVHKYGSIYSPSKLIKVITGEELKAGYFVDYLNKKYSDIYEL